MIDKDKKYDLTALKYTILRVLPGALLIAWVWFETSYYALVGVTILTSRIYCAIAFILFFLQGCVFGHYYTLEQLYYTKHM